MARDRYRPWAGGLPASRGLPGRTSPGWPGRAPTLAGLLMGCRQQQPRAHPSWVAWGSFCCCRSRINWGLCPGAGAPLNKGITRGCRVPPPPNVTHGQAVLTLRRARGDAADAHWMQCDVESWADQHSSLGGRCSRAPTTWEAPLASALRNHLQPLEPPEEKQNGMPVSRSRHPRQTVGACPVSRSRVRPQPPRGEGEKGPAASRTGKGPLQLAGRPVARKGTASPE